MQSVPVTGLYAQNKTVKSTIVVRDQEGKPVEGASVWYNEGAQLLKTDQSGRVELDPGKVGAQLRIEAEDYESRLIHADSISDRQFITVTLGKLPLYTGESSRIQIPFGQIESRRIVGAVSALNTEDLMKYDNNQNILGAINGRVAGIYGNRDIRGLGNAIVVIDGIPRSSPDNSDRLNMVDDLNLTDIKEITVLKDAVSKMLYGAKAGQGVIMIATKRGVPFKRKLNVYTESGLNNPVSYPEYLAASDYMTLYNEALANDGLVPKYTVTDILNTRDKADPVRYPDESFYSSKYLKTNSTFFKVITEASGGNERTRYYSSLGLNMNGSLYKAQQGKSSSSERLNFRGNVDYEINSWIDASLDAAAIYLANRYPNGYYGDSYSGDLFGFASTQLPNSFPTLIPADQIQNPALLESANLVDGKYLLGGTNQFGNNILGNLIYGGLQSTQQKAIQFNSALKFDLRSLLKGLTANANFTYDFLNSYTLRQNNTYAVYEPTFVQSSTGTDSLVVTQYGVNTKRDDQTVNGNYFQRRYGLYGTLAYKNIFNSVHKIDVTALTYLSTYTTGRSDAASYAKSKDQHFGLRVNYMFNNKYVAEFSGAYVGSSYLPESHRYAFSPSAGIAWIVSEENFLSANPVINYLKLKSSYGIINSDDAFNSYRLYNTIFSRGANFAYNNAGGNGNAVTQFVAIGNPDLRFVRNKEFNAGLESSLLGGKVGMEANYFDIRSEGEPVIRSGAYTSYLGGFIPIENYNENRNSGIEAALNYASGRGKLRYTLGANMIYAVPRVLRINEPQYAYEYRYREGRVRDAMFGYVAEGLFKDADDINNHAVQSFGAVQPGDIKYKDLNNDGIINDDDQMQIGNSHPRLQYGLNINLQYRSFSLFALGTAQSGSNVYYNNSYYWVFGQRKYSEVVLNRWTPATAETATYPRLTTTSGSNNFRNSTFWLYDDDYFTLNTVQFTYNLPAMHFWKGMQLYIRGNNLFTVSGTRKQRELNIASAPQMRSYMFGITGAF